MRSGARQSMMVCGLLLALSSASCGPVDHVATDGADQVAVVDAGAADATVADAGADAGADDVGRGSHVMGFTGAGSLDRRDPQAMAAFLASMGYADDLAFFSDVVDRMDALSGQLARAEFFYIGNGQFVGEQVLARKMIDRGFELYGDINPIPPFEGLDGSFDAALTTLVGSYPEIKEWQIGNEPDLLWTDPSRFPAFFVRAQPIVRAACPTCRVVLAGISNQYNSSDQSFQRYDSYLAEIAAADLSGRPFDVFDFHYYKQAPAAAEISAAVDSYRGLLVNHGLAAGVSFWCTETGLYTGDPVGPDFGPRTETEQARDLVRLVAWMRTRQVERIHFWTVVDSSQSAGAAGFFGQMGLVYNGLGDEPAGVEKKAYATFGVLARALVGTTTAQRVAPGVYRFDRVGSPVFVVWDEDSSGVVALEGFPGDRAQVEDLVSNDAGDLAKTVVEVIAGALTLPVGELPQLVTSALAH